MTEMQNRRGRPISPVEFRKHWVSPGSTQPNGALVVASYLLSTGDVGWRLRCSHCSCEWNARPHRVLGRVDASKCRSCAIRAKRDFKPRGYKQARVMKRVAKAIAVLTAEGYRVIAPKDGDDA